jgi:hypothetical protein
MFNVEESLNRKKRFIENCNYNEPTIPVLEMWFNKVAPIEKTTGKDLAEFTRDEIINLYKSFNLRSKQTLLTATYFFFNYYNWCLSEKYVTNTINQFDPNMIKSVIDEAIPIELLGDKYYRKQEMYDYIDMVYDPVNKFILYAPFRGCLGAEGEDIIHLKLSDINEETKTVNLYSGKILKVDDLFIKLAKEADKQMLYQPDKEAINYYGRLSYDESSYIIKTCRTKSKDTPVRYPILQQKIRLIKKQTGNRFINLKNSYDNGLINYIKERFEEIGVTLRNGLYLKKNVSQYEYSQQLEQFISEFNKGVDIKEINNGVTGRMLRRNLQDIIDYYE